MTAQELYETYKTMPGLQVHQLRVAAVGRMLAEHISDADVHAVTLAGLFHDMGNIIKADLTVFPEFLEPQGFSYWQQVKDEYVAAYGTDEHAATDAIAGNIGLPESVQYVISHIKFANTPDILASGPLELQIIKYADLRVAPHGVVSIEERLREGKKRYGGKPFDTGAPYSDEEYTRITDACFALEKMLLEKAGLKSEDVRDDVIAPAAETLRSYAIRE